MSKVTLNPYLFFTGNCREAMDFYHQILGGELDVKTFKDVGMGNNEATANHVMHATLMGGVADLMASDGTRQETYPVSQISLSLNGDDTQKLTEIFEKLAVGGKITSSLKKEAWGDTFGTVTDQFGIDWMVNISAQA